MPTNSTFERPPSETMIKTYRSEVKAMMHHSSQPEKEDDPDNLRQSFVRILRKRRSVEVPLSVIETKSVTEPLFQEPSIPNLSEAMAACPRAKIDSSLFKEENLYLTTEVMMMCYLFIGLNLQFSVAFYFSMFLQAGEQGRLPVLVLSLKGEEDKKKPAVVFLHSTNKNKEWLRPLLEGYASRGYVAIAIDSRYHGERATKTTYRDALISAWKHGETMPFIFDTVWDLIKLADYLMTRTDIEQTKIGITGESLGGMHAWFAAFADPRYAAVVPIISVQGFRWAIDNDMWHARVGSIRPVFEEACRELGKAEIDKEVVEKVWNRIAPGLDSRFDSPNTIPAIAPRPLLIINGAEDPRCPLSGLDTAESRASMAYEKAECVGKFKIIAQPGIGHEMTPFMVIEASNWFDKLFLH